MEGTLDQIDLQILQIVQPDAGRSLSQISRVVKRSQAACFKRLQRLRERGIIRRTVTLLDPEALNVAVTAMVTIQFNASAALSPGAVASALARLPEVMDVFRVAGSSNLLLRVVMPHKASATALIGKLRTIAPDGALNMTFVDCLHMNTALPLEFAAMSA